MSDNCIFTICAKNYLGLARILENSIKKHNPETDFLIFIADEFDTLVEVGDQSNIIISKNVLNIDEDIWLNMAFKYNVTEFCTSIKPFCFEYLITKLNYQKVIYLDPDTYLFNNLGYVFDNLDNYLFITTPHIVIPELCYSGELPENTILKVGINNLGFLGIHDSEKSRSIISWWQRKLVNQCFGELLYGTSTDQKWMDFLFAFLDNDEFLCSKNLGLNLAPWNYFERKIIKEQGQYYVVSRSNPTLSKDILIFAHFAGYNYSEFAKKNNNNKDRIRISSLNDYEDINELVNHFMNQIWENRDSFLKLLDLNYSYINFDNNVRIEGLHRRLYNGLYSNFNYRGNPFVVTKNSFYELLKCKGIISRDNPVKVDSLTPDNIDGFSRKLRIAYRLLRVFFKIIGYRNYVLFLQLIRRLSIYDINTFLLGSEYENKELR